MASPGVLGSILIDFSTKGSFPGEESVSAARVEESALPGALVALNAAKTELETEIRQLSKDSAPDVDTWITHAQSIQNDIETSKQLASRIVRQAEADDKRLEEQEDTRTYVEFMAKEVELNEHLRQALEEMQRLNDQLDDAETLASEGNIMAALNMLGGIVLCFVSRRPNTDYGTEAWETISEVSPDTTVRAMKILNQRCLTLKHAIYEQFEIIFKALVVVNMDDRAITINQTIPSTPMTLTEATDILQRYKEVDKAAKQLWQDLDEAILRPRTELRAAPLPKIQIDENCIRTSEQLADNNIKALFKELESVICFLIENLPSELVKSLSDAMMPTLSARVKDLWLDTAVPASLDEIEKYQKALVQVQEFAKTLEVLGWPESHSFHRWVEDAHKNWLNKKKETVLDWTRNELSLGLGTPQVAERVQKKMVPRDEGMQITATSNAVDDAWDAAWDSDKEDSSPVEDERLPRDRPERNRGSLEEEQRNSSMTSTPLVPEEDDPADAWDWNDEDAADEAAVDPDASEPATTRDVSVVAQQNSNTELRQVVISEKFQTSSIPQAILKAVIGVLNDGAILTQPKNESLPISPAAPGLFNLPTLLLAEYRALSPLYYAENMNGNMYLLNDTVWLSDQLQDFAAQWKEREDIPERAVRMIKIDPEINKLISFGNRAYTNELIAQRTIIHDLLAGTQNFFQQEKDEIKDGIRFVIQQVRERNKAWFDIIPWSSCASATGSLVNAVASKLITDIFELPNIGVDEAEHIATIISKVEGLDDLFIKPGQHGANAVPLTGQFADKWFKLSFLNQVLQSNLADIKYLWTESELSYYFTAEEVVDLIGLSFENNTNVRQTIKEIKANPTPKEGSE
ncbi:Centromere/kinetochore protein-like protein [Lachnellula willkommii]|uniref:Centromere/kinetochore protein-like protein n=1 Tax=Lachnellula willkommii TaxID=215461 RepID=A0A559M7K4_9HELO|nr:Centromere/kinetochore protein-like protein [Lachnellula willkommii]